jgi:hypothetical protein
MNASSPEWKVFHSGNIAVGPPCTFRVRFFFIGKSYRNCRSPVRTILMSGISQKIKQSESWQGVAVGKGGAGRNKRLSYPGLF